jgi:hypothetical protein
LISTEIFVLVLIKFFASQIAFEGFCLSIVFCFGASVLAVVLSFFSVPLFVVVFTFVLLSGVCVLLFVFSIGFSGVDFFPGTLQRSTVVVFAFVLLSGVCGVV